VHCGIDAPNHDEPGYLDEMPAPEAFAAWLAAHRHPDKALGHTYLYHPRSDAHSIALCQMVVDDVLAICRAFREQAARGEVAYGINLPYEFGATGKTKTLDLAIGTPAADQLIRPSQPITRVERLDELRIAMEAKSVMTEHKKSQPRVYDELSSSHEIVHQGNQATIAAGIVVVNIADRFVSPLRQRSPTDLHWSRHRQPDVTASMIRHLRGLPIRDRVGLVGFDAFAQVVIECDNQRGARLWTDPPAPQPGDRDYYDTFLARLSAFYIERFG
jgi:hypothetical protein